jgi:hypothetical protein
MSKAFLKMRFGPLDDGMCIVAEAISKLANEEWAALTINCSQEELLTRFCSVDLGQLRCKTTIISRV